MSKKSFEKSDIVVGLLFGDEGKGTTVDFLASEKEKVNAVVRFSGGAQTAHNVVTPSGQHHTFAQIGSASFHKVRTILSKYMLVDAFSLVNEANAFYDLTSYDVLSEMLISDNALLTTPIHAAINKKREILRGASAHGSCGMGIGETQYYFNQHGWKAPTVADLNNLSLLFVKLDYLIKYAEEEVGDISSLLPSLEDIKRSYYSLYEDGILNIVSDEQILEELRKGYNIFEGSQGVLLDENLGFHPNTTWSTTTPKNAQTLLAEAGLPAGNVIGVTRTYATRHGAGAFPSEFNNDEWQDKYPENHNKRGEFQGAWRAGDLDLPLLEYATRAIGGINELSITHLDIDTSTAVENYVGLGEIPTDYFDEDRDKQEAFSLRISEAKNAKLETSYKTEKELITLIEKACKTKCTIKSYGPTFEDKRRA